MPSDFTRYHRQMLLPGWGEVGQRRLADASALVVGVGALGSVSAELLVRAGVGRVVVVDRDVVELTNLQRQTLYAEREIGRAKAEAAADRLRAVNRSVNVAPVAADLDGELALELVGSTDLVVDGTDNFETRYVLNDAAVAAERLYVYGGAVGFRGTVLPVLPGTGPCLRCVADELPTQTETCDTVGVLGAVVQIVAARQAAIALRALLGEPVEPVLEAVDGWTGQTRRVDLRNARDQACVCCVHRRFEFLDAPATERAVSMCGRNSVHVRPGRSVGVDLDAVCSALSSHGRFESSGGLLRGEFSAERGADNQAIGVMLFADGRAIVTGTTDTARARSIYAKYIGG